MCEIKASTLAERRAEIRAGELLREMAKNKGTRGDGRPKLGGNSELPPKDTSPKLADLGVSKTQSSRWQKLAALPKDKQEAKIKAATQKAEAAIEPQPRKRSPPHNTTRHGTAHDGTTLHITPQHDTSRQIEIELLDLMNARVRNPCRGRFR